MMSGWTFLSVWKENEYIISTILTIITVILAVKIYKYQKNDHEKEMMKCAASEFDALFIHNFMELYNEFSPIFINPQGHSAKVKYCLERIYECPLNAEFTYWDVHRENVLSVWLKNCTEDERQKQADAIDLFVRKAKRITSNISSLKRDLRKAEKEGVEYLDKVTITPTQDTYLEVAGKAFLEMEVAIRNLPKDILIYEFPEKK